MYFFQAKNLSGISRMAYYCYCNCQDAADRCITVEFVVMEQTEPSLHYDDIEKFRNFNNSIYDLENCVIRKYIPGKFSDLKKLKQSSAYLHHALARWLFFLLIENFKLNHVNQYSEQLQLVLKICLLGNLFTLIINRAYFSLKYNSWN